MFGLEQLPDLVPIGAVDIVTGVYQASGPENVVSALFLLLDILQIVFLSRLFLTALLEVGPGRVRHACHVIHHMIAHHFLSPM